MSSHEIQGWLAEIGQFGWIDNETSPALAENVAELTLLIPRTAYKNGWAFIVDPQGLLYIDVETIDTQTDRPTTIRHTREIPVGRLDQDSMVTWLMSVIIDAERHEAMELFRFDGEAVFFPHGGGSPYEMKRRELRANS